MLIYYVYEDTLLEAVATKLIKQEKIGCVLKGLGIKYGGRSPMLARINKYRDLSEQSPVVLFIDLDTDECAPSLLKRYAIDNRERPNHFQVRVAVKEVESWLLADKQGIENYFGIPQNAIPHNPEVLENPKKDLFNLIKTKAKIQIKRRLLKKDKERANLKYNTLLTDFINTAWDSTRACANADSLVRAIKGIQKITP